MEINSNFKKPNGYVWYDDNECSLDVAGVKYYVQNLRKACNVKSPVMTLRQDPKNEYDENAVKILLGGYHIGYIDRDTAQQIADDIECGDLNFSDLVAMPITLIIDDENEYYNVEYSLILPKHYDIPRLRGDYFKLNIDPSKITVPQKQDDMIKIICPSCGQEYDVSESYIGQKVECDCGKKFIAEEAHKRCPMCGEKILLSAKKCKHCGEKFGIQRSEKTQRIKSVQAPTTVPKIPKTYYQTGGTAIKTQPPTMNVPKIPEIYYPLKKMTYSGVVVMLLSLPIASYSISMAGVIFMAGVLLVLVGWSKTNVKCSCGYDGGVKVRGGSFGCLFLLLLLGILPGLIYLIVCRNRYFCPACGREI